MLENIDTSLIDWSRAQFAFDRYLSLDFCAAYFRIGGNYGHHGNGVLPYG